MIEVLITWDDEEGKCFALCCVMSCFAEPLALTSLAHCFFLSLLSFCFCFLVIIFYLRWIGWVVSFAGTRRLCAWVRSNTVRRRVDWSGMARYQHHPRSAVSAVYTS